MAVREDVLLAVASHSAGTRARDNIDLTDIDQLPIEALLNTPTTVASTKAICSG